LFFVSLAVIYALLTFVLPQVIEQFVTSNVALPSLTLILLNFSNIFPYIVGSVLFISLGMYFYLNSPLSSETIKLQASKYLLKMPLFGEVIIYDQTARFCSSMRLMPKAGLNTIDSLRIAKDTFRNRYLRSEVDIVVSKVTSGTSLSQAFSKSTIFPNVFQQLLSSGDIGSQISLMFEKIKDFLDQEVQTRRNVLLTLLQPIVILTMGVFVMLIVLAIMLPLLQMNNLIFTL
jgi:general secretion pathway protein F